MSQLTELVAGGSLRVPMTFAEYEALGETKYSEYYEGVVTVNPPTRRHVIVNRRLTVLLDRHCPDGFEVLPEAGWETQHETLYIPDVMIAPRGAPGPDVLRVAPLLIVEVTLPSTRAQDLGHKRTAYAQSGAGWYWILEPDRDLLSVLRNDGHGGFDAVAEFDAEQRSVAIPPIVAEIDLLELFSE